MKNNTINKITKAKNKVIECSPEISIILTGTSIGFINLNFNINFLENIGMASISFVICCWFLEKSKNYRKDKFSIKNNNKNSK
ncbi:hypothetical protein [Psychromonas aquatilis]|uniref:Uncharacterized protein n=1 Tax=Psychromonas aquatilis TaxID=2005072 RepID=A0ABU9GRI7_9GAMM